jgi:predicted ATPase
MSRPRSTTSIVLPVMRHSVPRSRFLGARKPRNGYFLRAESFFYGEFPLHEQSHRQSFLALAANRFGGESL